MAMAYGHNDASHLNAVTDIDLNGTNRTFSYDLNGNMTGGYDLADPAAVVSRSITYTADNMPAAIIRGAATTSFIYDDGRRTKKTAGSNTTVYVNDLYEIINAAATKYIFAGNLRIAKITGTDIKYFHKDHLGSSTVMPNASGLSVETSEYLPYGGNRHQSGTSVSDYKFTNQELDTSTGFYNYDARLYDPVIGRFITPDTVIPDIYNPQDLNRYSYVRNNPLKYTDPTGHMAAYHALKTFEGLKQRRDEQDEAHKMFDEGKFDEASEKFSDSDETLDNAMDNARKAIMEGIKLETQVPSMITNPVKSFINELEKLAKEKINEAKLKASEEAEAKASEEAPDEGSNEGNSIGDDKEGNNAGGLESSDGWADG